MKIASKVPVSRPTASSTLSLDGSRSRSTSRRRAPLAPKKSSEPSFARSRLPKTLSSVTSVSTSSRAPRSLQDCKSSSRQFLDTPADVPTFRNSDSGPASPPPSTPDFPLAGFLPSPSPPKSLPSPSPPTSPSLPPRLPPSSSALLRPSPPSSTTSSPPPSTRPGTQRPSTTRTPSSRFSPPSSSSPRSKRRARSSRSSRRARANSKRSPELDDGRTSLSD